MTVSAPALGRALAAIVGAGQVSDDPAALQAVALDGRCPRWVVSAGSQEEVSRLLALAAEAGLAVAPRGAGTRGALGNPPGRLDVVLDLSRLDRILDWVPEDMVATVEPGLTLGTLSRHLASRGQRLPLDPAGWPTRSVGGVLATGDAGPLRYRYGASRDLALGIRFVQADGVIAWGGSRVVKSVTGYDVPKLLVGSLGTLGVIVEATLRLYPLPPEVGSWLCGFREPDGAAAALEALADSTLEPERVVMVAGRLPAALGLADAVAGLLVAFGSVPSAVRSQGEALTRLARARGATVSPVDEAVWRRLDALVQAPVVLRLAGEPARLVHWAAEIERRASRVGLLAFVAAEAGSGVIRAALAGAASPEVCRDEVLAPLREALAPRGGSVVVERSAADLKAVVDVWGPVSPDALALMRRLKAEFDPAGILNPGRYVGGL